MANEKEWQQDISTTVDAHTAKLSDHENRLNQAETNIADHEKRIDNIETTSDVGQFATRIQAIEEKNTEQDSAIDTLKKNVSDNLQTAKNYTDTQLKSYATKQENTDALEQAKDYTDNKVSKSFEQETTYVNQTFLPLTGGKLKATAEQATEINLNLDNGYFVLSGGTSYNTCARLYLSGSNTIGTNNSLMKDGAWVLQVPFKTDNSKYYVLKGTSSGELSFQNKNIVRSINNVTADINGNVTVSDVTSATKATQDGNGANIASTYVKIATAQTISAQHNFSTGVKINNCLITVG